MKNKKTLFILICVLLILLLVLITVIGIITRRKLKSYIFRELDDGSYMIEKINVGTIGTDLIIPAHYNGKKITVIGTEAISHQAIGVEKIEKIVISDSVTRIEAGAFPNLPNLKNVTVGANVAIIEESAFGGSYIGSISLNQSNTHFMLLNGCLCQDGIIIIGTDDSTIPEGIYRIGDYAFSEQKLKKVVLPASCIEIGQGAFLGCSNLEEIIFSEGLVDIGALAFQECLCLKQIVLPKSLCSIGDYCFYNSGIMEIVIPGSIKEIPYESFACCFNLKRITILTGVESIDYRAFFRCIRLEELHIPSSVTFIDTDAITATEELIIHYDGKKIPGEWCRDFIDFIGYWRDDVNESIEVNSVKIIFNNGTDEIQIEPSEKNSVN